MTQTAKVRDTRGRSGSMDEMPWAEVKVGDAVGFKADVEQYGTITRIEGTRLHLHNPNGFPGDYLRYVTDCVQDAGDCWLD